MVDEGKQQQQQQQQRLRERFMFCMLVFQSTCLLFVTVFCVLVLVYGTPLLLAEAENWKATALKELRELLARETLNWKSDILRDVKELMNGLAQNLTRELTEGLERKLVNYEPLTTLNVYELNQATAKVNRIFWGSRR